MKITTIGKPQIVNADGENVAVPGQQAWALLVRLLLAERPLARRTLAAELFRDAADPLGALRWCLASLRRALGPDTLRGDPVELNLPAGADVDLFAIAAARVDDIEPAELLEGIEPSASAEFSTWLLIAREQVSSQLHEELRRAAIEALARGDTERAIRHAGKAVRLRPLEESGHVLLVKALTAAGKIDVALAHVEATEKDFLAELGERPSRALREAVRRNVSDPPTGVSEAAVIDSLVKSGKAALAAGAADAGLDCLRQAAARAEKIADEHAIARTFLELGSALVHAIRGFDDEGAVMLRRAADTAARIGDFAIAAAALRELGYVEALAGRRPVAARYLRDALDFAANDDDALAGIHAITGFNLVDWGQREAGLSHYEQSLAFARRCGSRRREIWSLGLGSWGHLRAGNFETAEDWATKCIAMAEDVRWVAFLPWPRAIAVEARLAMGRAENSALMSLEEALALSSQMGDPCWEAANARAIALLKLGAGDYGQAARWLGHARDRCCSVTDLYAGLMVEIVADQMRLHQRTGHREEAADAARELLSLSARTHADAHLDMAMAMLGGGPAPEHRATRPRP